MAESTGYTPGPWAVSRDAVPDWHVQSSVYAEASGVRVATAFESEGNARLIAAAPELAAFIVEYARVSCECDDVPAGCGPCRARALLARVEGRA